MIEVMTYYSKEDEIQMQILDEFMASLDADRLLSTNDLYEAAKLYAPGPDVVLTDEETKKFEEIEAFTSAEVTNETVQTDKVKPVSKIKTTTPIKPNVVSPIVPASKPHFLPVRVDKIPTQKRNHEKAKIRLLKAGNFALAAVAVVLGVRLVDEISSASNEKVNKQSTELVVTPSTIEQVTSVTQPEKIIAEQITSEINTTLPETTQPTPTSTTQVEITSPIELTLTQRLINGETKLSDNKGMPIGTFRLDKFCDTVNVYINNPIDYRNTEVLASLSPDAQEKAKLIMAGGLTKDQRLMYEDDIMQSGLINGSGDPLYAASPDTTSEDGCVPTASNPRAIQRAFGSSIVKNAGGKSDQYQPTAVLSEFGSIPGRGKVTYISGHRSSQSASFNGLVQYQPGDTITYELDGHSVQYRLVTTQKIESSLSLPDIINYIQASSPGKDQLVAQVCIEGESDSRSIYIFQKA